MPDLLNLLQRASLLPTALACVALFLLMGMTFTDVMLRSIFNSPLEAATELTRLLMAVIVFSVLPIVSGRGEHISVDLLDRFFSPLLARIRDVLINLLCGAMLLLPAQRCSVLAERARDYGDVTEYLGIPLFYISWFIAVSAFITALVLISRGLLYLFAPQLIVNNNDLAGTTR